jgi:hypothetical protein
MIAYGVDPQATTPTAPILIFQGTPYYPTATGFLEALLTDLHPTHSIGEDIFKQGKAHIDQ